ncbi:alcohol dehydrogenase catalytic domain-containing protein [Phytohabitans sp. LJ34]|uniref:alcohol dehydrogenase catalytic domain-containing protein n=1 Tax=Phytohabitans sp. LJ34 TaxID=3452217 RepID=UPI003F8C35D5
MAAAGISGFVYGHEFAGIGEDGRAWFVEPTLYGGKCEQCRRGATQRCTEDGHGHLGVFRDGGMAERVLVPEYTLLPLPSTLDVRDACLIEPGAVARHAIRRKRGVPCRRRPHVRSDQGRHRTIRRHVAGCVEGSGKVLDRNHFAIPQEVIDVGYDAEWAIHVRAVPQRAYLALPAAPPPRALVRARSGDTLTAVSRSWM